MDTGAPVLVEDTVLPEYKPAESELAITLMRRGRPTDVDGNKPSVGAGGMRGRLKPTFMDQAVDMKNIVYVNDTDEGRRVAGLQNQCDDKKSVVHLDTHTLPASQVIHKQASKQQWKEVMQMYTGAQKRCQQLIETYQQNVPRRTSKGLMQSDCALGKWRDIMMEVLVALRERLGDEHLKYQQSYQKVVDHMSGAYRWGNLSLWNFVLVFKMSFPFYRGTARAYLTLI